MFVKKENNKVQIFLIVIYNIVSYIFRGIEHDQKTNAINTPV